MDVMVDGENREKLSKLSLNYIQRARCYDFYFPNSSAIERAINNTLHKSTSTLNIISFFPIWEFLLKEFWIHIGQVIQAWKPEV